jgi:hypothetical protein
MPVRRTVFFVSDRTGITAEMLGNSLLSQFEEIEFARLTIPFVDSEGRLGHRADQRHRSPRGRSAIVFSSIVDDTMSETIRRTNALSTLQCSSPRSKPSSRKLARGALHASPANTSRGWMRSTSRRPDDGAATRGSPGS